MKKLYLCPFSGLDGRSCVVSLPSNVTVVICAQVGFFYGVFQEYTYLKIRKEQSSQ